MEKQADAEKRAETLLSAATKKIMNETDTSVVPRAKANPDKEEDEDDESEEDEEQQEEDSIAEIVREMCDDDSSDSDEEPTEWPGNSLTHRVMCLWMQLWSSFVYDYLLIGHILLPNPIIMADVKSIGKTVDHIDAVKNLITKLFL